MFPRASTHRQPPGDMVNVGGFRLHSLVRGQGTPTVLLEPALGGFALQYTRVQSAVAAFAPVLAYDRAGQGWSDPSPNPRTPENIAAELARLLDCLNLHPPYVLVGHSFGGLLSRIYAGLHPQDVAGMVLVDATHVEEYAPFPDVDLFVRRAAAGVRLMKFAARVGLRRPVARLSLAGMAKELSKDDLEMFIEVTGRPLHHETMLAEFTQHRCYFGPQSQVPPVLGDIPLVVVTAENSVSGQGKIGGLTAAEMNHLHQKLQKDLVGLSPQGEQVIVPGASHLSLLFHPEHVARVVAAIRSVVEKAG